MIKNKCTLYGKELESFTKEELIDAIKMLAKLLQETRENLLTSLKLYY